MEISADIRLKNGLVIYRNYDHEGAIYMRNATTIDRYLELISMQPDCDKYGVFFAFSDEQFETGYNRLIELGMIKQGDRIWRYGDVSGMFCANADSVRGYFQFYAERAKMIRNECDPQEVYFYEWNNHECMLSYDGDIEAITHIIKIWGVHTARNLVRYNAFSPIEWIITPDEIKRDIELLGRLTSDCDYYLGAGKRNPKHLWAKNEREQLRKIHELWYKIPENYRPKWCSEVKIRNYEAKMCAGKAVLV